jgi:hypothetical protein
MNDDVEFPLPQRTPTPIPVRHPADAATERLDAPRNERYSTARRPYTNPDAGSTMLQVSPGITVDAGPTWNGFDTFLRRALMIAANIVLWSILVMSLLVGLFGAAIIHNLTNNSGSSTAVYDPGPVGPTPDVCEIDPTTDGC